MCTFNGAEFLPAQLESILAQTRPPDEIVVCDDASTDETTGILRSFAADSVKLKFNQQNVGSVKNFEQAISLCTGDVIALSDQDDVWREDKLELIESAFHKNPKQAWSFRTQRLWMNI